MAAPVTRATVQESESLQRAGIDSDAVATWRAAAPRATGDFAGDCARYSRFWEASDALLSRLPAKPARDTKQAEAAEWIKEVAREARTGFLRAHIETVYDRLTSNRSSFIRVEQLIYDAAALVPGLTPTRAQVEAESACHQRDKEGLEIDHGIFVSATLANPCTGRHLCHAMLLPHAGTAERLSELEHKGRVDLGAAEVFRKGRASHVIEKNPRHLNAEDATTIDAAEIAVDLAILDPQTQIGVLRGDYVQGGKYQGKRVLGSGINLTHLYYGKVPFIWYLQRDLGIVNKLYRGLARPEAMPDDVNGQTIEMPWIAVVEGFAIGGHCQYLLTMDYVLAAKDAFMSLPARKEGIIPGAANLRLPRFTGDRIARQAIMNQRRFDCDSPDGRLICDEVVAPANMDAAIERAVENLTGSGVVSSASNRRAFRVAQEPLDLFRNYFAVYALEQAYCHFSPALISNLEQHWNAKNRKL
ncbi:MAG TPA: enoyl-CoA hydratase/isomerase family protein [Burkholderiales bacterium]|nr:enoyl-CoA hydratase/isomerase family protein [Burkholderiales bacterium]